MRITLDDVSAQLDDEVEDDTLRAYLEALEHDPDWVVISVPDEAMWEVALYHTPTRVWHVRRFERVALHGVTMWRKM